MLHAVEGPPWGVEGRLTRQGARISLTPAASFDHAPRVECHWGAARLQNATSGVSRTSNQGVANGLGRHAHRLGVVPKVPHTGAPKGFTVADKRNGE